MLFWNNTSPPPPSLLDPFKENYFVPAFSTFKKYPEFDRKNIILNPNLNYFSLFYEKIKEKGRGGGVTIIKEKFIMNSCEFMIFHFISWGWQIWKIWNTSTFFLEFLIIKGRCCLIQFSVGVQILHYFDVWKT